MADHPRKMSRRAQPRSGKSSRKTRTSQPTGTISDFFGLLAGKTKKVATIKEINEAAHG
jgi:hypothetical protein